MCASVTCSWEHTEDGMLITPEDWEGWWWHQQGNLAFPSTSISTVVLCNVKCVSCIEKKRKTVKCSEDICHEISHFTGTQAVDVPCLLMYALAPCICCHVRWHDTILFFMSGLEMHPVWEKLGFPRKGKAHCPWWPVTLLLRVRVSVRVTIRVRASVRVGVRGQSQGEG